MLADKAKDGVSCGVSVTPVVNWRFYGKYKVYLKLFSSNESCESFSFVKQQESCWLTNLRAVFLGVLLSQVLAIGGFVVNIMFILN